ncbi:hypothetical protein [Microbacterium atlanticum]|uniref:hypothetical protein n=1 Tax=Microbacterium atlanticum TaxID=2782168 RepID=UPI001888B370|nr:hypothetical protein [Microbacterium atlanticum]
MFTQTDTEELVARDVALRWGVRLTPAAPHLWRVQDASGRVVGHLEAVAHSDGTRVRARRFHPPSRAFRDLGDFWSADDALECLRLGR